MKRIALYAVLLLSICAFNQCSKSVDSSPILSYAVNGFSDITVRQYIDTAISETLSVVYQSGTKGPVTLTVGNLPLGVSIALSSAQIAGTASFTASFTFNVKIMATGSYPITITTSSVAGTSKTYTFNILVVPNIPLVYNITGIPSSVNINQYSDTTLLIPLVATFVSGNVMPVTIIPDSLPHCITLIGSAAVGIPTFNDSLILKVIADTPGTYRVVLHATSSYGTQYYSFNVIVKATANCASAVAGTYSAITTCFSGMGNYTVTGTGVDISVDGITNEVHLPTPFGILIGDLDCTTSQFNLEPTVFGSNSIRGGGIFSANYVQAYYYFNASDSNTCTTAYFR